MDLFLCFTFVLICFVILYDTLSLSIKHSTLFFFVFVFNFFSCTKMLSFFHFPKTIHSVSTLSLFYSFVLNLSIFDVSFLVVSLFLNSKYLQTFMSLQLLYFCCCCTRHWVSHSISRFCLFSLSQATTSTYFFFFYKTVSLFVTKSLCLPSVFGVEVNQLIFVKKFSTSTSSIIVVVCIDVVKSRRVKICVCEERVDFVLYYIDVWIK